MKQTILILFLFSVVVTAACGQNPDMTIRVMTYNILKGAYPTDAPYDFDRADQIIDKINIYDPDILLLQECNQWTDLGNTRLAYFSTQLSMPYTAISTNHGSFKVALLSKYPITASNYLADDVYYWWNILTATVQLSSSRSVSIASTHFGWWGADSDFYSLPEYQQTQSYIAQKAILMNYLQSHVNGDLIIGGDWNHSANESPYSQGVLHDEIAALGYGKDVLRRFHPTENPIDNIYISRSGRFTVLNSYKLSTFESLSDHLPVIADIGIIFNPPPVIIQHPVSQTIDVNSTAVLTVNGLNQTSYAWYKSVDESNSTPADDISVGGNSDTLNISNFGTANEGYYYCILSNSYGSTNSDVAALLLSRSIQPKYITTELGGTAVFEVNGFSQANYSWYKSSDPCNSTAADDVSVGINSNTLTITNVQVANEGYYYCIVSTADINVPTDVVYLVGKRLVANWKFNNSLSEYVSGYTGTRVNPAVYATGIVGSGAINFSGDVNDSVVVSYRKKLNLNSFTFSAWAKVATGSSGTARILLNNRNTAAGDSSGILVYIRANNRWAFTVRKSDNTDSLVEGSEARENQWQFITITFEQTGISGNDLIGVMTLYIDGLIASQASDVLFRPNVSPVNMVIGSAWTLSSGYYNPFKGLVDDCRYYSYALNPHEAAQLYVDVTGQTMCIGGLNYDFNDDCIVDFKDFAIFASSWLEDSVIYPDNF